MKKFHQTKYINYFQLFNEIFEMDLRTRFEFPMEINLKKSPNRNFIKLMMVVVKCYLQCSLMQTFNCFLSFASINYRRVIDQNKNAITQLLRLYGMFDSAGEWTYHRTPSYPCTFKQFLIFDHHAFFPFSKPFPSSSNLIGFALCPFNLRYAMCGYSILQTSYLHHY